LEAFNIRHSGLDPVSSTGQSPESRLSFWIPAFAGMTHLIYTNIYATGKYISYRIAKCRGVKCQSRGKVLRALFKLIEVHEVG
jgi:hypothetical protein